jgi:hypothetical protein
MSEWAEIVRFVAGYRAVGVPETEQLVVFCVTPWGRAGVVLQ